jgi:hypothetical protein
MNEMLRNGRKEEDCMGIELKRMEYWGGMRRGRLR